MRSTVAQFINPVVSPQQVPHHILYHVKTEWYAISILIESTETRSFEGISWGQCSIDSSHYIIGRPKNLPRTMTVGYREAVKVCHLYGSGSVLRI